ncbi:MAG: rhodanese-like domain-containing protein [Gammaproteobacteria bacterium]|jgi:rhodanese-related sulfurtransferase
MLIQRFSMLFALMTFSLLAQAAANDEFPNRKLFPAVPVISIDQLYKQMDKVIIVDVRSKYEYDTINIVKAVNIPVLEPNFIDRMRQLRKQNPNTEIVAYCNGKTCKKSYKAVQKCRNAGIPNIVAYDQGIFDWAKKYPQTAQLLGKSPVNLRKLISKQDLQKHMISVEQFDRLAARNDVIVLDIREPLQREGVSLFPGIDKQADMDDKRLLNKYIDDALRNNKALLVYDGVGKQVEWLMYYLEDKGLKQYAFMQGGARAYYNALRKKFLQ